MASKYKDRARWAMMEAYWDEYIKETFEPWEFPQIVLITGDQVKYFKGPRNE